MRKQKKVPSFKASEGEKIKVQADSKTVIFIKKMSSFAKWKAQFPDAYIVS